MKRFFKKILHKIKKLLGLKSKWDYSYCEDIKIVFDSYENKTIKINRYFFWSMDYSLLALIRDMINQFTVKFIDHVDNDYHAEDINKMKDISKRFIEITERYENPKRSPVENTDDPMAGLEEDNKQYELFQADLKQLFNDLVDIWGKLWV